MTETDVIFRKAGGEFIPTSWGELNWKITGDGTPGAEMTFGTCRINPGERNQLHSHPDCEEILYVVSGHCEHKLGDALYRLEAGDAEGVAFPAMSAIGPAPSAPNRSLP